MTGLVNQSLSIVQEQLTQPMIPSGHQLDTNTYLIFARSVQIAAGNIVINCGAFAQGIFAQDSEILLQANTKSVLEFCVATHGGDITLYGESYIRVVKHSSSEFHFNYASQRGGAIYVYINSAPGVVPVPDCFLQYDQKWEDNRGSLVFCSNSAKDEGQSVYVSDIQNCYSGSGLNNITTDLAIYPKEYHIPVRTVWPSLVLGTKYDYAQCHYRELQLVDEFLVALMRFRLGLLTEAVAERFAVSLANFSHKFTKWVRFLMLYRELKGCYSHGQHRMTLVRICLQLHSCTWHCLIEKGLAYIVK